MADSTSTIAFSIYLKVMQKVNATLTTKQHCKKQQLDYLCNISPSDPSISKL